MPSEEKTTEQVSGDTEQVVSESENTNTLTKEIESAVDKVVEEMKSPKEDEVEKESEVVEDKSEDTGDEEVKDTDAESVDKEPDDSPKVSEELVERAVRAGISLADALEFSNDEALGRVVSHIEKVSKGNEKADAAEAEEDPFAKLPKLDPESYEPEVIQMFDQLVGIVKKQHETIKEFSGRAEESSRAYQVANEDEVTKWFDGRVKELGEDFSEALGKGEYNSLNRGGPQFQNREKIAKQMTVLFAGYNASGIKPPAREEVFDMAAQFILRDKFREIHERKLSGELKSRASQHVQRTGGSNNKKVLSPEEETANLLNAKFKT